MINHHGTLHRLSLRTALAARLTLLGLLAGLTTGAAQANESRDAGSSCRQETKRVAVWPKGPKAPKGARFEDREVTVCGGKVVSPRSPGVTSAKGK